MAHVHELWANIAVNDWLSVRICSNSGYEIAPRPREKYFMNSTSLSGSVTGIDRSMMVSIRLKIAVFAPMPSASESTATSVKTGLRPSNLTA
jgi:hypothetical protein